MANARSGNTYYMDTQYSTNEELSTTGKPLAVTDIIVRSTSTSAVVVLGDGASVKFSLAIAADDGVVHIPLAHPTSFRTSIRPITLTSAVCTVVFKEG